MAMAPLARFPPSGTTVCGAAATPPCRRQFSPSNAGNAASGRQGMRWAATMPQCHNATMPSSPEVEDSAIWKQGKRNLMVATAAAVAAMVAFQQPPLVSALAATENGPSFETYFGTAASASSYGGYGGNASKKDSAEYVFDVPQGWKERLISKVEKGTNGTDTEFYNPRKKNEKTYLTFLAGFRKLAPRDNVLNDLSLSDVNLQDDISQAESINSLDRTDADGQLYYEYEIDGPVAHSLISVTCAKNKLYAHFVKAPAQDWNRDEPMLRHIHDSFKTVGAAT